MSGLEMVQRGYESIDGNKATLLMVLSIPTLIAVIITVIMTVTALALNLPDGDGLKLTLDLVSTVINILLIPVSAAASYFGYRVVVGEHISVKSAFGYYHKLPALLGFTIIHAVTVLIGFLLLVLPGVLLLPGFTLGYTKILRDDEPVFSTSAHVLSALWKNLGQAFGLMVYLYILPFAAIALVSLVLTFISPLLNVVVAIAALVASVWWIPTIVTSYGALAREAFGSEESLKEATAPSL